MKFALFLGCTVPARARNYELSARNVAQRLGIELVDLDWTCCGFPVKGLSREACELMAARNLSLAREAELNIVTLCSACAGVLTEVSKELEDEKKMASVNRQLKEIGKEYRGGVKVKHLARVFFEDIGANEIKKQMVRELPLKIAPHYGCHYLKPSHFFDHFDDPEAPCSLHRLIEVTGATPVDYEDLKECCGGGILAANEEVALSLAADKLNHIVAHKTDALALVCPFCAVMYDDNQTKIGRQQGKDYNLPVLYLTQILGLGMGLDPKKELGMQFNKVKTKELLNKIEG